MRRTWVAMLAMGAALVAAGCGKTRFVHPTPPPPATGGGGALADVTNLNWSPGPNAGELTLTWTPSTSTGAGGYDVTLTDTTPPGTSTSAQVTPRTATGTAVPQSQPPPLSPLGQPSQTGTVTPVTVADLASNGGPYAFSVLVETLDAALTPASPGVSTVVNGPIAGPAAPQIPPSLTPLPGNGNVTLRWQLSATPASRMTGYQIWVIDPSTSPVPSVVQTINVGPTATQQLITGLTNGTTYTFRVLSQDQVGFGGSAQASATPSAAADTQAPSNVSGLTAVPASQQVTLTWNQATDNVGILQYNVTVTNLITSTVVQTLTVSPAAVPLGATVTGLTNGTPYRFSVIAQDPSGNLSPGGPGSFVDATPGSPGVGVAFSSPGGAYRNAAAPAVTLTGTVNGFQILGAATGVLFYTVDGSNPVVTTARAPDGTGVADPTTGASNGTFVQANPTPTPLALSGTLTSTQFGPTTAGAGSTATQINGTFPTTGVIRSGDVVLIIVQGTGGPPAGQTATIQNNGVSATALLVGAGLSAAPQTDTQFIVVRNRRSTVIRAYYDPAGTVGPPATSSTQAGITQSSRYFFFGQLANTYTPFGGMVQARDFHTATLLQTGASAGGVILFGGENTNPTTGLATWTDEFFDPNTEFFFRLGAPFPIAGTPLRQEHFAVRLDNGPQEIVIGGGRTIPTTGSLVSDLLPSATARTAERYSPVANSLSDANGAGFTARTMAGATLLSSRVGGTVDPNHVLVAGGLGVGTPVSGLTADGSSGSAVVNVTFALPVLTLGSIIEMTAPVQVAGERAVIIDNNAAASPVVQSVTVSPPFSASVGGGTFRFIPVVDTNCQTFNPGGAGSWSGAPSLPNRRWGHAMVLLQNGLVFVAGGHRETNPSSLNDIEKTTLLFDASSNSWRVAGTPQSSPFTTNSARLQSEKFFMSAALLLDGKVLVAGGIRDGSGHFTSNMVFRNTSLVTTADLYDPASDSTAKVGALVRPRVYHTATTLQDGRVLVTGGADTLTSASTLQSTATAELYSPLTRAFSATGTMLTPRWRHQATLLPDGRVLVTGGSGNPLPEIYDPSTGVFSATAGTSTADRTIGGALTLMASGNLLASGGQSPTQGAAAQGTSAGTVHNVAEVYDVSASQFRRTPGMAFARRFHTSTPLDDGRVLVVGGEGFTAGSSGATPSALATVETYDESTDSWTTQNGMSGGRSGHTATSLRGVVLHTSGTATFNGSTTVAGTGTTWFTDGVRAGDRIRLDSNGTFFEIVNTPTADSGAGSALTIAGPIGGIWPSGPIPGSLATPVTDVYTIRSENPYTVGVAQFTFGLTAVTGVNTAWNRTVQVGDLIRPAGPGAPTRTYRVAAVNSATSLTLASAHAGTSTGYGPFTANGGTTTSITTTGSPFLELLRGLSPNVGDVITITVGGGGPNAGETSTVTAVAGGTGNLTISPALSAAPTTTTQFVVNGAYTASAPGRLLVVGGGPQGSPLSSGELYDSVVDNWLSVTNSLAMGRFAHTATRLANGMVLIVGGNNNFDRTAELYDPAMNRFAQMVLPAIGTAVTAAARNNHSATLMPDGNVVLAGGDVAQSVCEMFRTDAGGVPTADADGDGFGTIDFNATTFASFTNTMSSGRVAHTATLLSGSRLLLLGGLSGANDDSDVLNYTGTVGTDTFTPFSLVGQGRTGMMYHMAQLMPTNNNVFILLGHTAQIFFSQ